MIHTDLCVIIDSWAIAVNIWYRYSIFANVWNLRLSLLLELIQYSQKYNRWFVHPSIFLKKKNVYFNQYGLVGTSSEPNCSKSRVARYFRHLNNWCSTTVGGKLYYYYYFAVISSESVGRNDYLSRSIDDIVSVAYNAVESRIQRQERIYRSACKTNVFGNFCCASRVRREIN